MKANVITSLKHPLVKHLIKLRLESAYRYEKQMVLLDGFKPIQEISFLINKVLYTSAYASSALALSGEKWQVTEAILHKISGMQSPEGILAEVHLPSFVELNTFKYVLALDGISDPGNMGTLLRTALALGWEAVYFLPGGCDPFNEKVLRAARGAHFKLALIKGTAKELQQWVTLKMVQPLLGDLEGEVPENVLKTSSRLLVLGNEAHGASASIRHFCQPVTIPMSGKMESLNVAVAGSLLLYLLSNFKKNQ